MLIKDKIPNINELQVQLTEKIISIVGYEVAVVENMYKTTIFRLITLIKSQGPLGP